MTEETKKELNRLIDLNEITSPNDERIATDIADRFPGEYSTEEEYIRIDII